MDEMKAQALERLFNLKTRGVLTEFEYEKKKVELLSVSPPEPPFINSFDARPSRLGQGASVLCGSVVALLTVVAVFSGGSDSHQKSMNEAVGFVVLFSVWIVPHSIWVMSRRGANPVMPIVALGLLISCCLICLGEI